MTCIYDTMFHIIIQVFFIYGLSGFMSTNDGFVFQ